MSDIIPVYKPLITGNEKKYINECIDSTWISSKGSFINKFENEFSKYISIKHSSSVCNGTVAIHLAIEALGITGGDEVIVPTFTYIASVNAIAYSGAKPVFVDSLIDTWNLDPVEIEKKITNKTKAILVVHLYGASCEMDKILELCKKYNLFLIEDTAEAFGSKYKNKYLGTFGDISTFSFFGNKTITTGEGGMVCTNNKLLNDKVNKLKNQGVSLEKEYWHNILGYNYRMTNICAAIGLAQLETADLIIKKKYKISEYYKRELNKSGLIFQSQPENSVHSQWMFSVLAENKNLRKNIRKELKNNGVETRPFFYPAHLMPVFKINSNYKVAESISDRGFNLPSYPALTEKQIIFICDIVKNALKCKS